MKKYFLALLFWLGCAPAWGQGVPTFDTFTMDVSADPTLIIVHTVGAGCTNPYLVVAVHTLVSDITHSSVVTTAGALTQIGSTLDYTDNGGADHWKLSLWGRAGPAGAQTVTITVSSAPLETWGFVRSYCGVNQSVPLGTAVGEADGSVNVTSAASELVIDAAMQRSTSPLTVTDQTERYNEILTYSRSGGSDKTGSATATMAWNGADLVIAVPLKPTAPAATIVRRRPMVLE